MILDKETLKYLHNDKFSSSLSVLISHAEDRVPDRINLLTRIVAEKKIVHLGCADHIEIIDEKIRSGRWLHDHLSSSARTCLGIDTDQDAINYLTNDLGYSNLVCADILTDDLPVLRENHWDYLVMGELLEHIDNPVAFLSTIVAKYAKNIDRFIITVPNAFAISNFLNVLKHKEQINSDHRYWFTPYTLSKVCIRAGLSVKEIVLCDYLPLKLTGWKAYIYHRLHPIRIAFRKFPGFRHDIVMIASNQ